MKNKLSYIAILGLALLAGCFPDKAEKALLYSGPTTVEIKNQNLGQLAANLTAKGIAAASTDSTRTVLLNTRVRDSILVLLVGPQSSTPVDVNYSVRSTSTAIEGTHYKFLTAGARKVTITPNTSSAYIVLEMIPNSLTTVGDTRTVNIDVQGNDLIKANPNFNKFLLTIRR